MTVALFGSLLDRVGSQGSYQYLYMLQLWLLAVLFGSSGFFIAFIFYPGTYSCLNIPSDNDCKEYVCKLEPVQRLSYIDPESFLSMAASFDDYRCDPRPLELIQSTVYGGGLLGLLGGIWLTSLMPKRRLILIMVGTSFLMMIGVLCAPSLWWAGVCLCLDFAARSIVYELSSCLVMEMVGPRLRGKMVIVVYLGFSIGVTINGVLFWGIRGWENVIFWTQAVPLLLAFLLEWLVLVDTPFDLVTFLSSQQAVSGFERMAAINNISNHNIDLEYIKSIQEEYRMNQRQKKQQKLTVLDLFRFDSLRMITILSIALHFTIFYEFTAPQFLLRNYQGSIFLNGSVIGMSQVFACLLCFWIIDSLERVRTVMMTTGAALAAALVLYLIQSVGIGQGTYFKYIETTGMFFYRFAGSLSYNFFYMSQFELFPTQIRTIALQITALGYVTGAIVLPMIQGWCERQDVSIYLTFILDSALLLLLMSRIPETFGQEPPEMIKELAYKSEVVSKEKDMQMSLIGHQ